MKVLTGATLLEALNTCDEHDGAKIAIACASSGTAKILIESLWSEVSDRKMPGWEMGREAFQGCVARLRKKGEKAYSQIEIFPVRFEYEVRGKSYHQVLYECHLAESLINELQWCERLFFDNREGNSEDDRSEELDKFLNSFKII